MLDIKEKLLSTNAVDDGINMQYYAQFFNIVFRIVRHFQSEGKFFGKEKETEKMTISYH